MGRGALCACVVYHLSAGPCSMTCWLRGNGSVCLPGVACRPGAVSKDMAPCLHVLMPGTIPVRGLWCPHITTGSNPIVSSSSSSMPSHAAALAAAATATAASASLDMCQPPHLPPQACHQPLPLQPSSFLTFPFNAQGFFGPGESKPPRGGPGNGAVTCTG
jgi:hypothetical protein